MSFSPYCRPRYAQERRAGQYHAVLHCCPLFALGCGMLSHGFLPVRAWKLPQTRNAALVEREEGIMLRSTVPISLWPQLACEPFLTFLHASRRPRARQALALTMGCLVVLSTLLSGASHAQQASPAAKAAAEALFDQGLKLMRDGQYVEACKRLESSQAMDPAIGTMLYLADCYEKQGRIASAWALFREASSAARQSGQADRAEAGRQRADNLESQLSTLIIEVPQAHAVADMVVSRNGITLPSASWGIAIPVDPGQHSISASAPNYETWEKTIVIDRNTAQTTVSVPKLTEAPEPVAPPPATEVAEPAPSEKGDTNDWQRVDTEPQIDPGLGDTQRIIGLVVGGVGVVTLGVGVFFGHRAVSRASVVEDLCGSATDCSTAVIGDSAAERAENLSLAAQRQEQAEDAATVANVLAITGVAATVGGALLYFLAPEQSEHVALEVTPSTAAFHLRGAF